MPETNPFEKHDRQKSFQELIVARAKAIRDGATLGESPTLPTRYTYRQLKEFLATLTEAQLDQQVQLLPPAEGETKPLVGLEPVFAAGTVEEMCHVGGEAVTRTASDLDWRHHPEQVVLLRDAHSWGEHGDCSYEMEERDGELVFVGVQSGVVEPVSKPGPYDLPAALARCPHMQPVPYFRAQTTPGLVARLRELSARSVAGTLDVFGTEELESIQAELYRREHSLSPREESDDD